MNFDSLELKIYFAWLDQTLTGHMPFKSISLFLGNGVPEFWGTEVDIVDRVQVHLVSDTRQAIRLLGIDGK